MGSPLFLLDLLTVHEPRARSAEHCSAWFEGAFSPAEQCSALRFMGSHVLTDLLTGHETRDRNAGHRPGQLANNRIHRAEAVLGAPVQGGGSRNIFSAKILASTSWFAAMVFPDVFWAIFFGQLTKVIR